MISDGSLPQPAGPVRQRRRAAAIQEIVSAAERKVAEHGPANFALRAVARNLGMSVQALYNYFPSRDALITELIIRAYLDLAGSVEDAVEEGTPISGAPEMVAAAERYRAWALANPGRFQLIYGSPLPGYRAPVDGRTTDAAKRTSAAFSSALFRGFSAAQLANAECPELSPQLQTLLANLPPDALGALPPRAATLFLSAWGHMHGLVILETFGHMAFIGPLQDEVFNVAMNNLLADVRRRIPAHAHAR